MGKGRKKGRRDGNSVDLEKTRLTFRLRATFLAWVDLCYLLKSARETIRPHGKKEYPDRFSTGYQRQLVGNVMRDANILFNTEYRPAEIGIYGEKK